MREAPFRAFAERHLRGAAPASYLSNCRLVERVAATDLDSADLDDDALELTRRRLQAGGVPPARVSDCLSALRMYRRFRDAAMDDPAAPDTLFASFPAPVATGVPAHPRLPLPPRSDSRGSDRAPDLIRNATPRALLELQAAAVDELRARGIARTANAPLGDYAEALFAHALGWTLLGNSTLGHDAVDTAGLRFQIKARRLADISASRQLGAIRRLEGCQFDLLAAILFDARFDVVAAALIPHAIVEAAAKPTTHTNSWRLMMTDRLIAAPGVRDVTDVLRAAHASFGDQKP